MDFAQENPPAKSPSKIQEIVQRALDIMTPETRFSGIEFKIQLKPDIPDVPVDPNQIQQVIMNIIINAAEAMNGKGALTIRADYVAPYVELEIEDNGPGIPEEALEYIFDPFFTTKKAPDGSATGLGLAIGYGIVKNHGGDILVNSRPGQGVTFNVKLPVTIE